MLLSFSRVGRIQSLLMLRVRDSLTFLGTFFSLILFVALFPAVLLQVGQVVGEAEPVFVLQPIVKVTVGYGGVGAVGRLLFNGGSPFG